MKIFLKFLVVALVLSSGFCQDDTSTESTTQESTTSETTTQPSTTPTESTTVTTTPTAPTTTATPPTTTSITSTSTAPTTTPSIPPTTTPSTPRTTPKTTSPVPSTTQGPIPTTPEPPTPEMGEWNVTDGNVTCIRADLKLRFKIPVGDKFEYIALSPNASRGDDSTCKSTNDTQVLHIEDSNYQIYMVFDKDGNTKTYVREIRFVYSLPSVRGDVSTDEPQFSVSSGFSYVCNTGSVSLENVTMEVMHVQLQSFGAVAELSFGTVEECEADNKVNDLVPIIVGCILLALVVLVLIAYFVGRRRSRQKGYQSV